MSFVSVIREAEKPEFRGFYVPHFEIRIQGSKLPSPVLKDVVELTYRDDVKQIDSIELSVNNWDDEHRRFKYIGSETAEELAQAGENDMQFKLFEPCNKTVEIHLGYLGQLRLMMTGNFTTMEPSFPSSGAPTLAVRGLNVLHQLRRKQFSHAWDHTKPSAVASEIQHLKDEGKPRFPLPIVIDDRALEKEAEIDYIAEDNQYDIDFLLNLARRFGYDLIVQEADKKRNIPKRLYFGPSKQARLPVNYELVWGGSLIEFTPTLTTANQVKAVTVRGWDRRAKKPISETITLDDPELRRLNPDLHEMLKVCDPREDDVVDLPVFTVAEARDKARARLMDRVRSMVKASGTTIGLPDLRAGSRVEIQKLGARLSGTYFVTDTTHTLGESGYTTRFNARREDEKGRPR